MRGPLGRAGRRRRRGGERRRLPDLYAVGGPRDVYDLFRQGIEGHIRQYTEAKTTVTELGRDGMYYKEYPTCFDPLHNGEGYHCLFQQGLCEPWDPTYRKRMKRFARLLPAGATRTSRRSPTTTPSTASSAAP